MPWQINFTERGRWVWELPVAEFGAEGRNGAEGEIGTN